MKAEGGSEPRPRTISLIPSPPPARVECGGAEYSAKTVGLLLGPSGHRARCMPAIGIPGGKAEAGRGRRRRRLKRELHEELGIAIETPYPGSTRDYDSPMAAVRLRFFRRRRALVGTLHGGETSGSSGRSPGAVEVEPLLPAERAILKALTLPAVYGHQQCQTAARRSSAAARARCYISGGLALCRCGKSSWRRCSARRCAAPVIAKAHCRRGEQACSVTETPRRPQRAGADGVHPRDAGPDGAHRAPGAGTRRRFLSRRPGARARGGICRDDFVVLGGARPHPAIPARANAGWKKSLSGSRLPRSPGLRVWVASRSRTSRRLGRRRPSASA